MAGKTPGVSEYSSIERGIRLSAAQQEPTETRLLKMMRTAKVTTAPRATYESKQSMMPNAVATPFPPWNRSQGEKQ